MMGTGKKDSKMAGESRQINKEMCMMVNSLMTRKMDLEFSLGLMEKAMKVSGKMESSMDLEKLLPKPK